MLIVGIKYSLDAMPQTSFAVTNPPDAGYTQAQAHPERNFVLELIRRLERNTDFTPQNLLVEVEIYKRFEGRPFDDELFHQSRVRLLADGDGVYPDLVIHEDQSNQENQALALECKTSPHLGYADFCKDLFKLMIYKEIFRFELVIFVIANKSPDVIRGYFARYRGDDEYYLNSDNLHILVREDADAPTTCINHPDGEC